MKLTFKKFTSAEDEKGSWYLFLHTVEEAQFYKKLGGSLGSSISGPGIIRSVESGEIIRVHPNGFWSHPDGFSYTNGKVTVKEERKVSIPLGGSIIEHWPND